MKKIAIIIQNLNGGGAERTAANLSLYFSEKYEVHLIVFDGRVISYPHGGMLHDLKVYPSKSKVQKAINVIRRVIKTSALKRKYGIETTISLMEESNIVNLLSNSGDKKITSIRNFESKSSYNSFFENFVMKLVRRKSDCVVALSKGVEEDLIDNCGVPKEIVTTIYNPCDGELLREKAKKHASDASEMAEYSVSAMGRLTEQKGQWHLIRAFKKVVKEIPEAKLYIFGQGILEEKLKKLATDLDIANNVEFMGFVEAPHAYIAKSKVFAFFAEGALTYGYSQGKTISGTGKEATGTYQKVNHFQIGVTPGLTAFVTNNLAVEVSVDVLGLDFRWVNQRTNQVEHGSFRTSAANFNINLFSINLGICSYF